MTGLIFVHVACQSCVHGFRLEVAVKHVLINACLHTFVVALMLEVLHRDSCRVDAHVIEDA